MKKAVFIILFNLITGVIYSQTVLGVVKDEQGSPLANVTIYITVNDVNMLGEETNNDGSFEWSSGATGNYEITASRVGYTAMTKSVSFISLNDSVFLNFVLIKNESLEAVEIIYVRPDRSVLGVTTLNQKDFNTLPGSFDDPTRLLIKSPGITMANDQANSIIYRGLPARYTNWSFNGAQIINPNHLSNAGTSLDIGSPTAGGVNAIGGQTMNDFTFKGGVGNQLFNTISGTSNVNSDQINRYMQLGLLGLEAGYNWSNVSIGYRYSFTGLLAELGTDFGGEKIGFQDVNFRFDPSWGDHKLILSATLGESYNRFEKLENPLTEKESRDIDYDAELWITSFNYHYRNFSMVGAWSGRSDKRSATNSETTYSSNTVFRDEKMFFNPNFTFFDKLNIGANVLFDLNDYEMITPERNNDLIPDTFSFNQNFLTFSPYANYSIEHSSFIIDARVKPVYYQYYDAFSFDFDLSLSRDFDRLGIVGLKGGHLSQGNDDFTLLFFNNENPIKSWVFELNHLLTKPSVFSLESAVFRYDVSNQFISQGGFHSFNNLDFNIFDETEITTNQGKARTYGLSLDFDLLTSPKYNLNINTTVISSQVKQEDEWTSSTQDYGYLANVVAGKVWSFKQNTRFLRVGLSGHIRGGAPQYPVIPSANNLYNQVDFSNGANVRLNTYYRVDMRVTYQTGPWNISLDIQNVSNNLNDGFLIKEPNETTINVQSQLGLIPVLSCRYQL